MNRLLNLMDAKERLAARIEVEKLLMHEEADTILLDASLHQAVMKSSVSGDIIMAYLARHLAFIAFASKPPNRSYDETISVISMFVCAGIQDAIEAHIDGEVAG